MSDNDAISRKRKYDKDLRTRRRLCREWTDIVNGKEVE